MSVSLMIGTQVRLMPMSPQDVKTLTRWYNDPDFLRLYDPGARPRTEDQIAQTIAAQQESPNSHVFAIRTLASPEMIGYVELDSIMWAQRVGWLSIGFGSAEHRGKGYGTEAMQLLLRFAFADLGLHRVQLTVYAHNFAAIHLYEKLGFVREGTFREFLELDGTRVDLCLYGILQREWQARAPFGR